MPKRFVKNVSDLGVDLGGQTLCPSEAVIPTIPSNRLTRNVGGKCKEQGRHEVF